jgi:shikimate kinase
MTFPDLPARLALIGFMGAGKTTVGKILALMLGYDFIDTDDIIAGMAGASIAEIFRQRGEPEFRSMEAEALHVLASRRKAVIAAGGGAPVQESNRQFFLSHAVTFHLRVSLVNARSRAQKPGGAVRPLLSQDEGTVLRLYESRRAIYEALGRSVETDSCTPSQVAGQIIRLLRDPRESRGPEETS